MTDNSVWIRYLLTSVSAFLVYKWHEYVHHLAVGPKDISHQCFLLGKYEFQKAIF